MGGVQAGAACCAPTGNTLMYWIGVRYAAETAKPGDHCSSSHERVGLCEVGIPYAAHDIKHRQIGVQVREDAVFCTGGDGPLPVLENPGCGVRYHAKPGMYGRGCTSFADGAGFCGIRGRDPANCVKSRAIGIQEARKSMFYGFILPTHPTPGVAPRDRNGLTGFQWVSII